MRPIYDIGGNSDVTYTINVYPGDTSHYDFAGQATEANSDYWTVYLIGAYQGWTREDGDGEDRVILGQVNKINGVGASIFSETIDHESTPTAYIFNAATTAHEIGHLFKGSHDGTYGMDGGIMDQSATRGSLSFTDATLKKIRDIDHP